MNQVDTLHTFDITFKFWPKKDAPPQKKKGVFDKIIDSAVSKAKGTVKNTLNNMTGGMMSAIMAKGKVDDLKEYDA